MYRQRVRRWQDYVESILIAILLALIVRTFIVSGYRVPTATMAPSLRPGDFIFSFRPLYGIRIPLSQKKIGSGIPDRNEIVVFTFPDQPRVNYVKRVIGIPGDLVEIRKGRLLVNGNIFEYQNLPDDYVNEMPNSGELQALLEKGPDGAHPIILRKQGPWKDFGPLVVPQGEVFMLGDNRDMSDDSRYWGTVPLARLEGKVFFIWLSLDWSKKRAESRWPIIRIERMGTFVR